MAERKLIIATDGAQIVVQHCDLSPLEVKSVLDILQTLLLDGRFPYPGPPPELEVVNRSEPSSPKEQP